MKDIHGQALLDFSNGERAATLTIHNNYDSPEEMPVEVFFREELDYTTLEHLALIECKGKVLDVGAGAGTHSLALQARGFEVVALENSHGCVDVLKSRGVSNIVSEDFQEHVGFYDTLLILMNGLGLAGTIAEVPQFLKKCISLLKPNGQILLDSSDISYLYVEGIEPPSDYHGEVRYQYEYKGEKGLWFDWVYVDPQMLKRIAQALDINLEILHTEETDQYLARITR